ncbi:MAG: hybrid sensor histidine kinase/response regulator [Deltaproteobacteria bacterium]|nr:hybrid sensor histidine kinase/response regulator [Deltaproteobacteria bacterium]
MNVSGSSVQDLSVLVIDDDASVREVLAEYLRDRGFECRSESCGELGLVALGRSPCDIVITDLRMPGLSGLDVVRMARDRWPDVEVIVITGYATIEDGVEAMRQGAYDFLLKPLKIDQLDAILARCVEWIRHKRSHAELQEVNRRLLELSHMKTKFLAVTDHELRTPVTALDGMLQFLLRKTRDLPEDVRTRLEQLCLVSRRLVDLVRGIHDLAQCRTHQFPVFPDWTDADAVARSILLDFDIARFNRELRLTLRQEVPRDVRVRADLHRLRQAVTELVQNAVKATDDGGCVDVRLTLGDTPAGGRLLVVVTDTGVGIPTTEQEKIFEAFYEVADERHHHTSKHEFGGAGLGIGLSIALEIARAHGGGIDVKSEPGRGSEFTLWVPLV